MVYDGEKIFGKQSFAKQTRLPVEHRVLLTKNVLHSCLGIIVQSKKECSWDSARVYLLIDYGYIAIYLMDNFGYALNLQKAAAIKKKQCLSISLLFEQGEVTLEFDDAKKHSQWWNALKAIMKSADVVAAAPKRKFGKARQEVRFSFHGDINDIEDDIVAESPAFFFSTQTPRPAMSHGAALSTSRPKRSQWATAASPDVVPTAESPHESKVVYARPTPDPVGFVSPPRAAAEVDDDANNEEELLSPARLSNRLTPPQRSPSTLGTPSSVKAQHKQAKTPVSGRLQAAERNGDQLFDEDADDEAISQTPPSSSRETPVSSVKAQHKQAKTTPLSLAHHRQAEELEIAPLQFDQTFEVFNPSSSQQQQVAPPPPNMDFLPRTPSPTRPPDAPTPRRSDRLKNKKKVNYKK